MKKVVQTVSALVAAYALVGCASINSYQTAETLGEGKMQVHVAPGLGLVSGSTAPRLDVGILYGMGETMDLGLRVGGTLLPGISLGLGGTTGSSFAPNLEVLFKNQFSDRANKDLAISLAPSLGVGFASGGTALSLSVPVLIGIAVGEHQLVLGPKVVDYLIFGGPSATNVLNVGATVGFAAKITDSLKILPEVGLMLPILSSAGAGSTSLVLQFGVGVLFGL
jgi:hypothetical protein